VHPVIYAEAAGYLLDKNEIVGIRDMLFRAYEEDPFVPEIHYALARYNRRTDAFQEERQALDNAIRAFERARPLSSRRLEKQIDTFILSGEYWYERDEILRAQEDLTTAIDTYERAKNDAFLSPSRRLARVYARSGDIQYYDARRYDQALERYDAAATDGYETDELNFKRGFIHYRNENYERATELFYDIGATNEFDGPDNVIYARANTLYQRGNYIAAEALYSELLDRLQTQRARINTLLVDEDTTHCRPPPSSPATTCATLTPANAPWLPTWRTSISRRFSTPSRAALSPRYTKSSHAIPRRSSGRGRGGAYTSNIQPWRSATAPYCSPFSSCNSSRVSSPIARSRNTRSVPLWVSDSR
jgi:hypothetical protein